MNFWTRKPVIEAKPSTRYNGPYLGEYANNRNYLLYYELANLNMLSFGAPGSLKTVGLCVPNAHLPQSIVWLDSKGQALAITGRLRKKLGKVIKISPKDLSGDPWSPMHQIAPPDSDHFMPDCECVATSMQGKATEAHGNERFFEINAANVVGVAIAHERMTRGDKADLRSVRRLMSLPSVFNAKREPVAGFALALKQMSESSNYAVSTTASRILSRMSDTSAQTTSLQDVIDTALKDMKWLNDDTTAISMENGSINWASLHKEITTIYIVIPIEDLAEDSLGKYVRIFLNLAMRQLYRSAPKNGAATLPRIMFMLDEFASLGRLHELPKILGTSRDFSLIMWFFLQSISQLNTNYKDDMSLFFNGSGVLSTFRCGDYETAEYLSKVFGSAEQWVMTRQPDGQMSFAQEAVPMLRPDDLMRLPPRMTINLIQPCPYPILGHVPLYTETPWAKELDANPYYRG